MKGLNSNYYCEMSKYFTLLSSRGPLGRKPKVNLKWNSHFLHRVVYHNSFHFFMDSEISERGRRKKNSKMVLRSVKLDGGRARLANFCAQGLSIFHAALDLLIY